MNDWSWMKILCYHYSVTWQSHDYHAVCSPLIGWWLSHASSADLRTDTWEDRSAAVVYTRPLPAYPLADTRFRIIKEEGACRYITLEHSRFRAFTPFRTLHTATTHLLKYWNCRASSDNCLCNSHEWLQCAMSMYIHTYIHTYVRTYIRTYVCRYVPSVIKSLMGVLGIRACLVS